jgi:3-oxoacyl-[acyl-carrier protein] reductase
MDVKDAVALVTGGGTGIGRATSLALARRGAAVAVNYSRSRAEAEETVAEITALGGHALAVQADVSRDAEVRAMVERVVAELGGLDLLVNNAGTTRHIPLNDLEAVTDDDWERIFAVNVRGIFYCSRAAAPHMKRRGRGAIVNTGSVGGLLGDGSSLPYAVSKAAVVGLTKALARALAPEIRVCSVAPGIVETRWVAGREEHVRRLSQDTLLHRNASPDDVAAMICALLEQDSMTGQTLVIDGGRLL